MSDILEEKLKKLTETTRSLGKVGLLIFEEEEIFGESAKKTENIFQDLQYKKCADYLEIMDSLVAGEGKIFYTERGEKLDGLVLEIIAEFDTGMVSLADRKNNTGLKTAKWNPRNVSFIVVINREQVERSNSHLFDYINITQSV